MTIKQTARQAAQARLTEMGYPLIDCSVLADAVAVAVLREVADRVSAIDSASLSDSYSEHPDLIWRGDVLAKLGLADFTSAPVTPELPKETPNGRPIADSRDTDLAVRPVVSATDPTPLAVQAVTPESPRQMTEDGATCLCGKGEFHSDHGTDEGQHPFEAACDEVPEALTNWRCRTCGQSAAWHPWSITNGEQEKETHQSAASTPSESGHAKSEGGAESQSTTPKRSEDSRETSLVSVGSDTQATPGIPPRWSAVPSTPSLERETMKIREILTAIQSQCNGRADEFSQRVWNLAEQALAAFTPAEVRPEPSPQRQEGNDWGIPGLSKETYRHGGGLPNIPNKAGADRRPSPEPPSTLSADHFVDAGKMVTDTSSPAPPVEPVPPVTEPVYPCRECRTPRTKAEGGTTFTVCDACWDKAHPKEDDK